MLNRRHFLKSLAAGASGRRRHKPRVAVTAPDIEAGPLQWADRFFLLQHFSDDLIASHLDQRFLLAFPLEEVQAEARKRGLIDY